MSDISNNEVWKDVVGLEERMMVSNFGRIKSKCTNKLLKLQTSGYGYKNLATKVGGRLGRDVIIYAHKCVAEAFIPNPEIKPQVNHIDGNKLNNSVDNLEWCTVSENIKHAHRIGLINVEQKSGTFAYNSKFNTEDIEFIRQSKTSCRKLAKMYQVHHTTISKIKRNVRYVNIVSDVHPL